MIRAADLNLGTSSPALLGVFIVADGETGWSEGWEQYLELATTEIREYGAASIQVLRRLRAMLEELATEIPLRHRPPVQRELRMLDLTVTDHFPAEVDRPLAAASDR